ncbi:MAG: hypothetical protein NT076_01945 [Candidatus Pacearchaeota archaeon]|nr:hypothetical protein [Candidatus Pacearchaeota archaeon]
MQKQVLLITCIAISFLGIFFLLILAGANNLSVQGKIISIKDYSGFQIIKLDSNKTVTCDSCNLKLNQTVQVQGKIEYYQSQVQISANKIEIIKNVN